MKKDEIEFHSYLPYGGPPMVPAANVKVRKWIESIELPLCEGITRSPDPTSPDGYGPEVEHYTDPRFTHEWIEENVSQGSRDGWLWETACQSGWEWLEMEVERIWGPGYGVASAGRSGGWAYVTYNQGDRMFSPAWDKDDVAGWDAVAVSKWTGFVKSCRAAADDVPYQMVMSIYYNEFEMWSEEQQSKLDAFNSDILAMGVR